MGLQLYDRLLFLLESAKATHSVYGAFRSLWPGNVFSLARFSFTNPVHHYLPMARMSRRYAVVSAAIRSVIF